jgi:hypothetical protein
MIRLRTIHPYLVASDAEHSRNLVWMFAPGYLILHGIIATCLPQKFDPLSTIFIVLAESAAIIACATTLKTSCASAKTLWLLLCGAIFIHSMAMGLEAVTEITQTPILNHVGGFQILLSMLYAVPLLAAVSIQHDQRILRVVRIISTVLSIAFGAVLYFEVFTS